MTWFGFTVFFIMTSDLYDFICYFPNPSWYYLNTPIVWSLYVPNVVSSPTKPWFLRGLLFILSRLHLLESRQLATRSLVLAHSRGVCAWIPVTLTPAASRTLASWAAANGDMWHWVAKYNRIVLGEFACWGAELLEKAISILLNIYDGHMSDVYIYKYICVRVCVWDGGFDLVISFVEHFETHMAHMINAFHCWGDPIPCWHLFLWPFPWPSTFWSWCNLGGRRVQEASQ